jgi:hypothetical protein
MGEDGDPVITDLTDDPTTGDELIIHVSVNTTEEIENVHVEYSQDGVNITNVSMRGLDDEFLAGIIVDEHSRFLEYRFYVKTKEGNWTVSGLFNRTVFDNDPPRLYPLGVSQTLVTGGSFGFLARSFDNHHLAGLWVIFWFGDAVDEATNLSFEKIYITWGGPETHRSIGGFEVPFDSLDALYYQMFSIDDAGNINESGVIRLEVFDNVRPEIKEDLTETNASTGEDMWFRVNVSDNIGIAGVVLSLNGVLINMSAENIYGWGNGTYRHRISIEGGRTSPIMYNFTVTDLHGNQLTTREVTIDVEDNDTPSFVRYFHTSTYKGRFITFAVDAVDNIGVNLTTVEYWFNDEAHVTLALNRTPPQIDPLSMAVGDFARSILIPRDAEGTISYFFTIEDAAGNNASTNVTTVPLVNGVPHIEDIDVWNVTEGIEASLDLVPYLFDYNDPIEDLTIEVANEAAWIDGFILHVLYDVWKANDTLVIRVSDGEDTAIGNIPVLITNVNDEPEIVSLVPLNDARFYEGIPITFRVSVDDEDGDPLTITWQRGIDVLHDGEMFNTTELGPGRHVITLYIHDGHVEVRLDIAIEVLSVPEIDQEPARDVFGFWMWASVIALTSIAFVVVALVWVLRGNVKDQSNRPRPPPVP